jgi:ornithine cyclodeaminase
MRVLDKRQIQDAYRPALALAMARIGFIAYSEGRVRQPPVQHFAFAGANGDCCIKSGHLEGDKVFVVKVASGFYDNPKLGLDSTQGVMMAFSAEDGRPLALLMDEGWLTAQRTALAGLVAARALAPPRVEAIGIVGTGMQARLQLEALREVTPCRRVYVWGRSARETQRFSDQFESSAYQVTPTLDAEELARACQLIVTCTPSTEAILLPHWIRPGTHITAAGADAEGKQELAAQLVARADLVVVDSVAQCADFGEVSHAVKAGLLRRERLVELGHVLAGTHAGRRDADQITIADLTGLAIQDVQIAKSILLSGHGGSA